MVSGERESAAKRAELAQKTEKVASWILYGAGGAAFVGLGLLSGGWGGFLLGGGISLVTGFVAGPSSSRANENKQRVSDLRNPEIPDSDPNLPSLRRNYGREISTASKAIASLVASRFKKAK